MRASAAKAASLTVRRMPITVDTSTRHLRAASAWLISPAVICRKISHFVSADKLVGRRRSLLASDMNCSSRIIREDCQAWVISHPELCGEVRRKTGPKVVAAGVLENFVVVGEVVEYQRLTGLQTPDEIGEQRFFDTRRGVQHSATDQVATRHVEVVARRLVDVPVAEIDDLAGGVPHRFQEHARVEECVGGGPQHLNGRMIACRRRTIILRGGLSGHRLILGPGRTSKRRIDLPAVSG